MISIMISIMISDTPGQKFNVVYYDTSVIMSSHTLGQLNEFVMIIGQAIDKIVTLQ